MNTYATDSRPATIFKAGDTVLVIKGWQYLDWVPTGTEIVLSQSKITGEWLGQGIVDGIPTTLCIPKETTKYVRKNNG